MRGKAPCREAPGRKVAASRPLQKKKAA